jgi:antitoxin (DNA-binding transcriptional repressor) of toxin-antitoxin stability system
MTTIKFTEFRNNASFYLTRAEKGEIIRIIRHGKVIAEITPPSSETDKTSVWKKKGLQLEVKGKSLSSAILEERKID